MDGVHDVRATGEGRERHAAGDALGGGDEVGHDALVVGGEPVAGAAEPGLHLVGDEQDALLGAPVGDLLHEARRGHDEPALALDRLEDDGRRVVLADLGVHEVDELRERLVGARPPDPVGQR